MEYRGLPYFLELTAKISDITTKFSIVGPRSHKNIDVTTWSLDKMIQNAALCIERNTYTAYNSRD